MPTTPKRWAVWDALKTAMQAITRPTYNYDLVAKAVTIGSQSHEAGERIRIEIFPDNGIHDPEAADSSESILRADVFGWVRPNASENGLEASEKLLQDIINAVHVEHTLGGVVTRAWVVETEADDGLDDLERDWRWCMAKFELQQFHGFGEH